MGEELFVVRKAKHVGRGHIRKGTNCQDANAFFKGVIKGQETIIAIGCDGCSEGTDSEVGATLGTQFMIREVLGLLNKGVPVNVVPDVLYQRLLEFLRGITVNGYDFLSPRDKVNFIRDHLLFTVVGCIVTEEEAILFSAGDGTFVINDEIVFIKQNNAPYYPAYHLVERSYLEASASDLPATFATSIVDRSSLKKLAVGSDAWHDERKLLQEIWEFNNPAGLQRKINVWSEKSKKFEDDVSIITIEVFDPRPTPALTMLEQIGEEAEESLVELPPDEALEE